MTKDELVHEIGSLLVNDPKISSRTWENLVIVAQLTDLSIKVNGFAYEPGGDAVPTSPRNPKVPGKFKELQTVMGEPWKACLVRINNPSGEISIDFEYDHPEKWLITPATVTKMADDLRPRQV